MRVRRLDERGRGPSPPDDAVEATPDVRLDRQQLLALQRTAGNRAACRALAVRTIQRTLVYSHISGTIQDNRYNDDEYYKKIPGFKQVKTLDGVLVWTDARNEAVVAGMHANGNGATAATMADPAPAIEALGPVITAATALAVPRSHGPATKAAPPKTRQVHVAMMGGATDTPEWQTGTSMADRLELLEQARKTAMKVWDRKWDASALYVFLAPEYFFAAQSKSTHFMGAEDHDKVVAKLDKIAATLPPNVLFIPGTVGWSKPIKDLVESDFDPAGPAPSGSHATSAPAPALKSPLDELKARHQTLLTLVKNLRTKQGKDYVFALDTEQLEANWKHEAKSETADMAVFNRAYVYFNQTRDHYDKMVESPDAGGSPDRLVGDQDARFFHGVTPFAKEYMDIRVSLEICSDLATDIAGILQVPPTLQLAPASYYGGAGFTASGQLVALADSRDPAFAKDEETPYDPDDVVDGVLFLTRELPTTTKL